MQQASEIRLGGKFTLEEIEAEHIRRVVANTRTLDEAADDPGHRSRDALPEAEKAVSLAGPFSGFRANCTARFDQRLQNAMLFQPARISIKS